MRRIIITATSSVTLLLILILVSIMGIRSRERAHILNRLEKLEQLVTAKQIYKEVLYLKKTEDFLWIPLKHREFLISVKYNITAGIDISRGYDISRVSGKYIIKLPRAEVFSIDADDKSIKEYFIKERFSQVKRDDFFSMIQDSKSEIIAGEEIKDLLNLAENNAARLFISLMQMTNINVEVEFIPMIEAELL